MTDEHAYYECEHCLNKFSKEQRVATHACKPRERWEYLSTKDGYAAYDDYTYWLSLKKAKSNPGKRTFRDSKFFQSFREFQNFIRDKGIPDRQLYIRHMIERNIPPMMWRMSGTYDMFIRYFDHEVPVETKVQISFKLIEQLARIMDCHKVYVFDNLYASEISRLVFERRLSPWVLLLNKSFLTYMHNLKSVDQYRLLYTTIDMDTWKVTFRENSNDVERVKKQLDNFYSDK